MEINYWLEKLALYCGESEGEVSKIRKIGRNVMVFGTSRFKITYSSAPRKIQYSLQGAPETISESLKAHIEIKSKEKGNYIKIIEIENEDFTLMGYFEKQERILEKVPAGRQSVEKGRVLRINSIDGLIRFIEENL